MSEEELNIFSDYDSRILYVENMTSSKINEIVRRFSNINLSSYEQGNILGSSESQNEEEVINDAFMFWVEGVSLSLISLFGIIGTSMSIRVLLKPDMRESFSGLLTGLAFCDVLFLIFSICLFGIPKLWPWFGMRVSNRLMPIGIGVIHIWRVGSTALTVSITIERYFAIVRPLKRFQYQRYLLAGSMIFATLYNIPRFFEFKSMQMRTGEYALMTSDLRNDPLYIQIYVFWSKFIFIELVPWFTIVILNTLILLTIMKSMRFRQDFVSSSTGGSSGQQEMSVRGQSLKPGHYRTSVRMVLETEETFYCLGSLESSEKLHMRRSKSVPNIQHKIESPQERFICLRKSQRRLRRNSMPVSLERRLSRRCRRRRQYQSLHEVPSTRPSLRVILRNNPSPPTISTFSSFSHLGRTLIGVSVLFLFCQSFKIIPDVYEGIWCNVQSPEPGGGPCPSNTLIDILISLSNLLMCINSAMNFVMYMLRGSKFRLAFTKTYRLHRLVKLYHCLRERRQSPLPRTN